MREKSPKTQANNSKDVEENQSETQMNDILFDWLTDWLIDWWLMFKEVEW